MGLIVGNGPGNDLNLSEDKIKAYRKFSNKLWNIARFVLESIDGADAATLARSESTEGLRADWIAEFDAIAKDVTSDLDNFRYYLASEKLYHYVWHTFADKLIEESKPLLAMTPENAGNRAQTQATLLYLLRRSLILLHPFMPFITEEIWSHIPPTAEGKKSLIISRWMA
jgi:valyl-tRNA synthetase